MSSICSRTDRPNTRPARSAAPGVPRFAAAVASSCVAAILAWLPSPAVAQGAAAAQGSWPTKPVRIMVGANPGGGSDAIARILAEQFTQSQNQAFVIENRAGASNTIAADITAKAEKDGHTLMVAASTPVSIAPHLMKLGYDTLKDLQPVGLIALVPNVLIVNKDMGINTVAELVADMKKRPGHHKYGSSGFGSTHVILNEQFNLSAGVKALHVPYKGAGQTKIDLIAGHIQMTFDTVPAALSQILAGSVKPLAVTSPKRLPEMPDVPTIAEAGYPDVEIQVMYALYTTGGTPRAVVDRINATLNAALQNASVAKRLTDFGGAITLLGVDEFTAFNRKEYDRFGELIRKAGIKAE